MTYPFNRSSNPVGDGQLSASDIDKSFAVPVGAMIIELCDHLRLSDGRKLNHDIAAGQSHHETGGGTSRIFREKNNPGGIGAENHDPFRTAYTFPTLRDGYAAYIAGLVTYNDPNPSDEVRRLDARFAIRQQKGYVGIVQREDRALYEYEQRYAWSPEDEYNTTPAHDRYGGRVAKRTNLLYENAGRGNTGMNAQISGYKWHPADPTHFSRGRTARIQGFAVHYTGGTNSLGWLTKDSGRDDPDNRVSSTFLIKHEPSLEDRGWQLVRIEDTAWTTGGIVNPKTLSFEYEHKPDVHSSIPDIAYEVMARTIYESDIYVRDKNLGAIEVIKGHRDWVEDSRVCPDGIQVARIVKRFQELKAKPAPSEMNDQVTGKRVAGGIYIAYTALGDDGRRLANWGRPLSNEFIAFVAGADRTCQWFEHGVVAWYPEGLPHGVPPSNPQHIRMLDYSEGISALTQLLRRIAP